MEAPQLEAKLVAAAASETEEGEVAPEAVMQVLVPYLKEAAKAAPKPSRLQEAAIALIGAWRDADKGPKA